MKSKGSIPRLTSTLDVSETHANSPYPQWMKALEDKYQKLHTKIMQTTNVSSVRQLTALSKTKRSEATLSRLGNRAHTYTYKTSLSLSKAGIRDAKSSDASKGGLQLSKSDTHYTQGAGQGATGLLEVTGASEDTGEQEEKRDTEEDQHADEDVRGLRSIIGKPDCFLGSGWSTPADDMNNREVSIEDGAAQRRDLVKHGTVAFGTKTKVNYLVTNLPPLRDMKTCVSRISNKTAKSCPAVIESTVDYPPPSTRMRLNASERPQNTSKRKNMRLFAKMSLEAQHAITETLQEMGGDNSSINPDKSYAAGGHRGDSSGSAGRSDAVTGRLCSSHTRDDSISSTRSCSSSSGASNLSDPRDRKALMGDCMFPEISGRSKRLPRSMDTLEYTEQLRIPGVGRYRIIRPIQERTFQITFGDFDIRYREIISLNREGSETPPAEVKQKAIAKCHNWLAKHMYR